MAEVKKEKAPENITVTVSQLILQNIDRSRADLRKWWNRLQNAESVHNPNPAGLFDLCERAITDAYLTGLMEKRVASVLNKRLYYEIDGKRIPEMDGYIQSDKFRLLMRRLWEKKAWGRKGVEFIPGSKLDFAEIPIKHIMTESAMITFEQNGTEGVSYLDNPFIYVVTDVERFGLLMKSVPYTILKNGSLSDLAQYIEQFGQPIKKGTYPADDPELKAEMKDAMKESGGSLNIMLPEGTNIEIIGDNVTGGNGAVHKVMFDQCNNELSVLWLGNTETTGNINGGSNAKAKEQGHQQDEITKLDLLDMQDMLSNVKLQTIFKSYTMPVNPEKGKFVFEKEIDIERLKSEKEIDTFLIDTVKLPLDDDYFYQKYGREKPAKYNELKKTMEEKQKQSAAPPQPAEPGSSGPVRPEKKGKKLSAWYQKLSDFFAEAR